VCQGLGRGRRRGLSDADGRTRARLPATPPVAPLARTPRRGRLKRAGCVNAAATLGQGAAVATGHVGDHPLPGVTGVPAGR